MSSNSFRTVFVLACAVSVAGVAEPAFASGRGHSRRPVVVGRAVPRHRPLRVVAPRFIAPRVISPRVVTIVPYRPSYYYRPGVTFGFAYGSRYAPYGYYASAYPRYGYVRGAAYGGVRIDLPQRDAQVFVDGYYVGIVDQFDGVLQHLDLAAGPHRIEARADGFETIAFDVYVQPGRTITYRADMQRALP